LTDVAQSENHSDLAEIENLLDSLEHKF
jgi:hypothetical protein